MMRIRVDPRVVGYTSCGRRKGVRLQRSLRTTPRKKERSVVVLEVHCLTRWKLPHTSKVLSFGSSDEGNYDRRFRSSSTFTLKTFDFLGLNSGPTMDLNMKMFRGTHKEPTR